LIVGTAALRPTAEAPQRPRPGATGSVAAVIPLRDLNPTRRRPVVTVLLIGVCIGVYFFIEPAGRNAVMHQTGATSSQQADTEFTYEYAAIPCEVVHDRPLTASEVTNGCQRHAAGTPVFPHKNVWLAVLFSMFLHASLLHIGGNMLFLWIFGNNIEDRFGPVAYLIFYLVAGLFATGAYVLVNADSTVPLLGASGAIAGVMGAYLVFFPRAPIRTLILIPPIILWPRVPAWALLVVWFVSQFFLSPGSGVAWVAHVAGFAFGALVGMVVGSRGAPAPAPRVP
jgi:membrane associated rhomboid family serine protease